MKNVHDSGKFHSPDNIEFLFLLFYKEELDRYAIA